MNRRCRIVAALIGLYGCAATGTAWSQPTPFSVEADLFSDEGLASLFSTSNIAVEIERGFVIAGTGVIEPGSPAHALLLHVDRDGTSASVTRYQHRGKADNLQARSVVISHDREHLIVTGIAGYSGPGGAWAAKIETASMDVVWSHWLGTKEEGVAESGTFVLRLSGDRMGNEDYLIGGEILSWLGLPKTSNQFLARISDEGELRWARRYDRTAGVTWDDPTMAIESRGNIYVAGLRDNSYPYVMSVEPTTGELLSEVYYYSHGSLRAVDGRPHLAEVKDNFVLAYGLRSPGPGPNVTQEAAALILDESLDAQQGQSYVAPGALKSVAAFYDGNEIHLNTMNDHRAGFLRLDSDGNGLSHHVFGFPQSDMVISPPMSAVSSGYLVVDVGLPDRRLHLARTDRFGQAPCMSDTIFDQVDLEFMQHADDYTSTRWGEIGSYDVVMERGSEVRGKSCR